MSIYRICLSRAPGISIAPEGGLSAPVLNLRRLYAGVQRARLREHRIRRDSRQFAQLNDRLLKDIGLERSKHPDAPRFGRDIYWRA
ncbi:hypothetical protein Q5Y75_09010 [Ruegeria sp. 2205SS24-7]|uniref:hypothetical protein n=1 Tax=Ruegeria discodermiae TaxID=3064389 RepID=UPI0027408A21|nr:hypothetical protein [Ruegeria sp. 2205SS24-7]MDP5217352.1 hypothetical protein [Ruegeria sp. 2205SS24-7]